MTTTLITGAAGIALLPEAPRRLGPVSRFLVLRLLSVLAVMQVVGAILVFAVDGARARAAGLSLVFPGGGLLYDAHPELFVASAALMLLAVVLWWGISAHFAIPLVWALGVAVAAWRADGGRLFADHGARWEWVVPAAYGATALTLAAVVTWFERKYRRKRALIPALNEYLAGAELPRVTRPTPEPDDHDAEMLAWVYDLALQPLDEFVGFDWGEQFHGPTCVRYQLDFLGWALAEYAVNHVPNAPQPIEQAMRQLIEKQTDLRVWRYWRTMNLIGNFDANPDPLVRDNIMMSAYLLNLVNLYEAATGSTHFDEPGSLTFVWTDGRTFPYDHHSVADAVLRNFEQSRLGFFPCEPGWAFTACNTIGAEGLFGYDTTHGARHWRDFEPRWRRTALEEYAQPDGLFPHIKSTKVGLSFDTGEVPNGEYPTTGLHGFADIAPDLAARAGALALRGAAAKMRSLAGTIRDGRLAMELPLKRERNIPITTAVPEWTRLVGGARAVGEFDLALAARESMFAQCGTGEAWPGRPLHASVQSIAIHLFSWWGMPLSTAVLNQRGYVAPRGPMLGAVPWPDVLVTKARSADGASLDVALRPRRAGALPGLVLSFSALTSGTTYSLDGAGIRRQLVAGADGTATLTVDLDGPLTARLAPFGAAA